MATDSRAESGHRVLVQRVAEQARVPKDDAFLRWLEPVLGLGSGGLEMTIRVVDEEEGRRLNLDYRGKDRATNVLSFPSVLPEEIQCRLSETSGRRILGDLVICAPVVQREAEEQGKTCTDHWAHLVVHGALHLLGYDHEERRQAEVMERLETRILADCGIPDPYATD